MLPFPCGPGNLWVPCVSVKSMPRVGPQLILIACLWAQPHLAAADGPRDGEAARGDALEGPLRALEGCIGVEEGLRTLADRWEEALAEASWDEGAEGPRAFGRRVGAPLMATFLRRDLPAPVRRLALALLTQLRWPEAARLFDRMLERGTCPADWTALAGHGLSRLDVTGGHERIVSAFLAAVPPERAPHDDAWALCSAAARGLRGAPSEALAEAARRLFLFAPQAATAACFPVVLRLPDAPALARRVLDGDEWPAQVGGEDPRDAAILLPYGRGAALLVLGELRTDDALDRLAAALADTDPDHEPTRDGAIQGLAAVAGPRARRLLRVTLRDPDRRTPRIAHALLRLGDVASANTLRDLALDGDALVEMRVSAANAYTLLVQGRLRLVRDWERDLPRSPRFGPPFEALDRRMVEMTERLVVAERCRRTETCWAESLTGDVQTSARAFWQLSRAELGDPEVTAALAAVAARALYETPPNEQHDRVAGAIAVLARLDPELSRPHLGVVRRARVAWEGRTNPMGLPFDIPLALGQLEGRIAP